MPFHVVNPHTCQRPVVGIMIAFADTAIDAGTANRVVFSVAITLVVPTPSTIVAPSMAARATGLRADFKYSPSRPICTAFPAAADTRASARSAEVSIPRNTVGVSARHGP